MRDVPESIDGTLKPGGIGLRISSRGELECVAGAHRAAQAEPVRSGSPRRTGTARPTTMVLDADVVVESLTDGTLSESIRNVFSGRDEQRASSRGTREVTGQAAAQAPLIGRMWELVSPRHRPRRRLELLGRKQPAPAGLYTSDAVGHRGHRVRFTCGSQRLLLSHPVR